MPNPARRPLTGLALFGGVLAVSTAAIFIRAAQSAGAGSILIAAARLTLASLVLLPLALIRHRPALATLGRGNWLLALLAGLFLALHFASWISSLEYTSVVRSVVLVTTTPLWVGLLSPLVLKERLGRRVALGLLLALAGGLVIALGGTCAWQAGRLGCTPLTPHDNRVLSGDLLALFGAWMAAGYLLIGRRLRERLDLVPYVAIVYGMAAVILVLFVLLQGTGPANLLPQAYLWFLLLALVPQLIGHSTFNWALKYLPASFVSVILLGEPVGSSLLAFLIFGERPSWIEVAGAGCILAGIWIAARGAGSAGGEPID